MQLTSLFLNPKNVNVSTSTFNLVTIYTLTNTIHIQKTTSSSSYGYIDKTAPTIKNDNIDKVNIVKS